jgi:hypothetical protein
MADGIRERPLQSLCWGALGSAAVFAGLLAAVLMAVVIGLLTLGGAAFWTVALWALGSAALVAAYSVSVAYLATVVVALAGGRLMLGAGRTNQRIGAMLALAAGLLLYVVLRSILIVDTLTGLIVVLLGVGAISGWLWRILRPTRPVAEEPSVDGPVADEPVVEKEING